MTDETKPTTEETTALERYQVDSALAPDMAQVTAYAQRIKKTVPGLKGISDWGAVAAAQYALMSGANIARGEMYAYEDNHGLHIVEGYKLLIRWAKRQCNYNEWYEPMEPDQLKAGDIGTKCFILRDDSKPLLNNLLKAGMDLDHAMDIATTSAYGVVRAREMQKDAPSGWNWEQVAKKRALKNALNLAYGMPSPEELAHETWTVDDVVTIAEDWDGTENLTPADREANAKYNAQLRKRKRETSKVTATQAVDDLFGAEAAEQFSENVPDEPPAPIVINGEMEPVEDLPFDDPPLDDESDLETPIEPVPMPDGVKNDETLIAAALATWPDVYANPGGVSMALAAYGKGWRKKPMAELWAALDADVRSRQQ